MMDGADEGGDGHEEVLEGWRHVCAHAVGLDKERWARQVEDWRKTWGESLSLANLNSRVLSFCRSNNVTTPGTNHSTYCSDCSKRFEPAAPIPQRTSRTSDYPRARLSITEWMGRVRVWRESWV